MTTNPDPIETVLRRVADIPYPLRLVVETIHYCVFLNPVTGDMKCGDLLPLIARIYGDDLVKQAGEILSGKDPRAVDEAIGGGG